MSTEPKTYLTPEQYLEIERNAEFKSEYYQGEMFAMGEARGEFAMAGARWNHNRLIWNLIAQLDRQLRSRPCQGAPSDIRVYAPATGLYTYPDVLVVCGEPQFVDEQRDTLLNPTLIVEVLSPSTEAYDRGRKFEHYRSIPSLQQYLLVATDRVHVDWYTRQPNGQWLLASAGKPEEMITLDSVGCQLTASDLYEKVELA
jgi:Uma2 family endonuclease